MPEPAEELILAHDHPLHRACSYDILPAPVEVAAYYVVSEALTNAAKHANASVVHVAVQVRDGVLELSVCDGGSGGADPARGSGLVCLTDRVDALGGTIELASPAGLGTTLRVTLPAEAS